MALDLKHQTAAEFAARFWARLKAAYQAGDLTNDQVRLSFNTAYGRSLTLTQWNSFVTTKLVPIKDRYLAMLAEGDL